MMLRQLVTIPRRLLASMQSQHVGQPHTCPPLVSKLSSSSRKLAHGAAVPRSAASSGGGDSPTAAAAAAGGSFTPGPSSAPATTSSSNAIPSYEEWRQLWASFLRQAYQLGHYAADPEVSEAALDSNPGVMKRAVLSLARQRSDILRALDPVKLRALVLAGFPVDDRKTKNAHRRLQASIVDGRDLGPADGGPAEFQDLMRVFLSLAACDQRDAGLFKPLLAATAAVLPDIMSAAAAKPAPGAAPKQASLRYMPGQDPREASTSKRQPAPQQRRKGDAQVEGRREEGRYEGAGRSSSGRSGRGGAGGRGGRGGRTGGGRGGRGAQQQQRPGQQQQRDGGSSDLGWWNGD